MDKRKEIGQSSPNFINGVKRTVCEVWTRLMKIFRAMGYCRPVRNFNKGKKSEFAERKYFTEEKALNHCPYCGADYPPSKKGE